MKIRTIAIAAIAIQLGACTTYSSAPKENLKVMSTPDGAHVKIRSMAPKSHEMKCRTPCTKSLYTDQNYAVMVKKDGYESIEVDVTSATLTGQGGGMEGLIPNTIYVQLGEAGTKSYLTDMNGNKIDAIMNTKGTAGTKHAVQQYESLTDEEKRMVDEQLKN